MNTRKHVHLLNHPLNDQLYLVGSGAAIMKITFDYKKDDGVYTTASMPEGGRVR